MKKIFLVGLILLLTSCFMQKGQWINGKCRPKNSNFKLSRVPFKETDELVFNNVYEGVSTSLGFGFYKDGRLICFNSDDGSALKREDVFGKNWDNAIAIGYWRFDENKIRIEFFVCHDGGFYNFKQGEIKGDTIVLYKNIYHPFRKEVREERYILSKIYHW